MALALLQAPARPRQRRSLSSSELFLGSLLQHKRKEQNHINPLFPPLADQNLDGFFCKMLYFLGFQSNVSSIRKMRMIGARAARYM